MLMINSFELLADCRISQIHSPLAADTQDLDVSPSNRRDDCVARTPEILKVPERAIEVQERAGAHHPSIAFDPVQREYLTFGMRLNAHGEAFQWSGSRDFGPARNHFPGSGTSNWRSRRW
jgi:hypothetical protein